jgi:fibronectin-binding autotransporter adhesin
MKNYVIRLFAVLTISLGTTRMALAANDTWTGSGADDNWMTPANWGVLAPSPGDFLYWGSGPTTANNNFPSGTLFGNLQFKSGSASFTLTGNGILLTNLYDSAGGFAPSELPGFQNTSFGSISNLSINAQTINLPVELMNGYHFISTVTSGNLNLHGPITRDIGGVVTFYKSGSGAINLSGSGLTTNGFNNILGGWAVLNDTNWATVDANTNVIPASYVIVPATVTNAPTFNYIVTSTAPNLAAGGATINTLQITNLGAGTFTFAAPTDMLRVGQNGGIMLANTIAGANWNIGAAAGSGIITAGSSGNSELFLCEADPTSAASGQLTVNSIITDNGGGKVTVVKNGGQNLVFGATNTYTGGTYINQSRIAPTFAGAMGYGPIFVNNGGQFWARANITFTNDLYISGSGNGESQQFGAVRFNGSQSCILGGTVHVLVATPKVSNSGTITGQITGTAGMRFASAEASGTSPTIIAISNPNNNYDGDTIIWGDHFQIYLRMSNSLVIPSGAGKGNVILTNSAIANDNAVLDMNGFNETVNGLVSGGAASQDLVTNINSGVTATLTIGNNNATATFGGNIGVGNGNIALTKTGGGTETLTGSNNYSGLTTITGGKLLLSGTASIAKSASVAVTGGTLDISQMTTTGTNALLQGLAMTNGALTVALNPSTTNIQATSLAAGGANNTINIYSVSGLSGAAYPTNFTVINYSGALAGATNFIFGSLPSVTTGGYITNVNSALIVVLTNGPKPLVWKGADSINPTFWDVATTTNWLFNGSPTDFNNADSVTFNDTASTNNVNVATAVAVGSVTVNTTAGYTLSGAGSISGIGSLTKQGGGALNLLEGGDNFSGGVTVSGGSVTFGGNNAISGGLTLASGTTVQVGTNDGPTGTLPSGNVANSGSLIFDSSANLAASGVISGSGTITNLGTGTLALNGANTFTGVVAVVQGTVQMGSAAALGTTDGGTYIASGGTLDVNGFSAGSEPVFVQGPGAGGNGAIINSGASQITAFQRVTLTGNTTVGGSGRWDVRSANTGDATQGSLLTGGSAFNLTKIGTNEIALAGITVDSELGNIDVQHGLLSVESATTGLGNPAGTLTVESGAALQLYQLTTALDKTIVLNGDGVDDTLIALSSTSSSQNTIQPSVGSLTLTGSCIMDLVNGTSLNINNTVVGTGGLTEAGTGTLTLGGTVNYAGATIVNAGATLTGANGAGVTGPMTLNGTLVPGGFNSAGTFYTGPLTLNTNSTIILDLSGASDQVVVNGALTVNGTNMLSLVPQVNQLAAKGTEVVATYTGTTLPSSVTNQLVLSNGVPGYAFALLDPQTTPGQLVITNLHVPVQQYWKGGGVFPNQWDLTSLNWSSNNTAVIDAFNTSDSVFFPDGATTFNVSLTNQAIQPIQVQFGNSANAYTLSGQGWLAGPMQMIINGQNSVVIANGGNGNSFTGGVLLQNGTLQLGNGDTNGLLGTGGITNDSGQNATLVFDRSDIAVLSNYFDFENQLTTIIQNGSGVTSLRGILTNIQDCAIVVQNGTLQLATAQPVTNNFASITITNSATLDLSNAVANLQELPITVSGAGVGGNGAIVNSGTQGVVTFVTPNITAVTLAGNTTMGGSSRFDWRDEQQTNINAYLNTMPPGSPYNLTKVGSNQLSMVGVQVDPAFGNFIVSNGILSFEVMTTFGNAASNITIWSNASVSFYQLSNKVNKALVLEGGAQLTNSSGTNFFIGPISTMGSNDIGMAGTWLEIDGQISGTGGIARTGGSALYLSTNETYTGPTWVTGGTLLLTNLAGGAPANDASIASSSAINLNGGNIDVTPLSTHTLTALSSQSVSGTGTIAGNLVVNGPFSPGLTNATGTLTVTNNATIGGSAATAMYISATAQTNTVLATSGSATSINYAGSLAVTNVAGNLKSGMMFTLFKTGTGGFGGSGFVPVTLPPLGPGLSWNNNLGINGTISVGGTLTPPSFTSESLVGTTLTLSGNNGIPNGTYKVLTSLSVTNPIATWTPIATNTYSGSGTFSVPVANVSTNIQQYFLLQE